MYMTEQFARTEILLGDEAMERLARARVAVFGIGGVGGYVCEALGRYKTEVMRERILEINPAARVREHRCFFLPENAEQFPFAEYDYVVDAVDTVTAKIELILRAQEKQVPVISSMGAGNKLDASAFRVADIYATKVCPLARVMRRELKKRNVEHLKVVYSEEEPLMPQEQEIRAEEKRSSMRRAVPGSVAFVPSVAGLILAGEVIRDLAGGSQRCGKRG